MLRKEWLLTVSTILIQLAAGMFSILATTHIILKSNSQELALQLTL
ncbi:hypothetical protein [Desulfosporosinus sp. HMP52]|nr:hypothetical protein [Desulfosporosinus sp. HMP52]